ncbi:MAG: S8 family serine peptidase [Caldilineaceae bacterium]|nr:S8 family serine peptidase [Caldilineaceae bacterium]
MAAALLWLRFPLPLPAESTEQTSAPQEVTVPGQSASNRLIVELQSPGIAQVFGRERIALTDSVAFAAQNDAVEVYAYQLQNEQEAFRNELDNLQSQVAASSYTGLDGVAHPLAFNAVTNAMVLQSSSGFGPEAAAAISSLPNVRAVHRDLEIQAQLYAGPQLIRAWTRTSDGNPGRFDGTGVLVGSIDAGLHNQAPMFNGNGFAYPDWYPEGGLGITAANNGKIVVSRTYFRTADPPRSNDFHAWPGAGSSHGVHTGAIAAGNIVTDAAFRGMALPTLSGIAPQAWLGSYRVFYNSQSGKKTFFTAEGVAALEDTVKDGMDVVIGSWGTGPSVNSSPYNFLDSALVNAASTDMVVVMAAGNYGPMPFSVANPSDSYLTVGAVSTGGRFSMQSADVSRLGQPNQRLLTDLEFNQAEFGPRFRAGQIHTYPLLDGATIDSANPYGCQAWRPSSLTGQVVIVERGFCSFVSKVINAQEAGSSAVVVQNHAGGGNALVRMSQDNTNRAVRIPALFMGHDTGMAIRQHLAQASLQLIVSTTPTQRGNHPLVVPEFSGRGPTVFGTLKPDLVAPGVSIMSQGYALSPVTELRHKGYGQASGTSMAAPFAAGAAALLKQAHPEWTNDQVFSTMANTADFRGLRNPDGSPAGLLDMGSGLLNIERAIANTLFLVPHKADFGLVGQATGDLTRSITIANTGSAHRSLQLSLVQAGTTGLPPLSHVSVVPSQINLPAGDTATATITLDLDEATGPGILEGFLLISDGLDEWHAPVFAWLTAHPPSPQVVLIDADLSPLHPDVSPWYRRTLTTLGIDFLYWDTALNLVNVPPVLFAASPPEWVILFTGDHAGNPQASNVPLPFSDGDLDLLGQYLASGGNVLVMGKHGHKVLGSSELRLALLSGVKIQEQTADRYGQTQLQVSGVQPGIDGWGDLVLDLARPNNDLGQTPLTSSGTGTSHADNPLSGQVAWSLQPATESLLMDATVDGSALRGIKSIHLVHEQEGATVVGDPLWSTPHLAPIDGRFQWQGRVTLSAEQEIARRQGSLRLNVEVQTAASTFLQANAPVLAPQADNAEGALPLHTLTTGTQAGSAEAWLALQDQTDGATRVVGVALPNTKDGSGRGTAYLATFGLEHINDLGPGTNRAQFISKILASTQDAGSDPVGN